MSEKSLSPRRSRSFLMRRILAAGLCLACSAILAVAATGGAPPATGERLAAELPVFGVAVRGEWNNDRVRSLVRQSGVTWARTSVSWAGVQPSPEVFSWAGPDAELQLAQDAGIVPLVLVWQNPSWAASTTCGKIDRVPLQSFYNFVYALAGRYDGDGDYDEDGDSDGPPLPRVDYWEFYNEPDNQLTNEAWVGGCWGSYGADYAQMLKQAWAAIHAANAQGKVVFGAIAAEDIAYGSAPHMFNFNILGNDFVDAVLTYVKNNPSLPNQYFDFFNFHFFPAFHTVWDPYGAGLIGKATYYRNRMSSKGMSRPLMCSESGRRSDPGQVIDGIPGSNEEQSRYVVRLFTQAMAADVKGLTWLNLGDFGQPEQGGFMAWGLFDGSYQPKPSFSAFTTTISQLGQAAFSGNLSDTLKLGTTAEGYAFSLPGGSARWVIWAKNRLPPNPPEPPPILVNVTGSQVQTTDKWGVAATYIDGQAGDADNTLNGKVKIAIGGSPVFVDVPGRPAATVAIGGTVAYQGHGPSGTARWSLPVQITIYDTGTSTVLDTCSATTDTQGRFTCAVYVYPWTVMDIQVKQRHTLSNKKIAVSAGATGATVDLGTLLEGDADGNDRVTITDFSILRTTYGQTCPACDARADFNEDGQVSITDFSLLRSNYAKGGPITLSYTGESLRIDEDEP